ncbi:MAG TPA: hypothetical protein VF427_01500, partial [Noviherbaspirillum sp.]
AAAGMHTQAMQKPMTMPIIDRFFMKTPEIFIYGVPCSSQAMLKVNFFLTITTFLAVLRLKGITAPSTG